MMGSKSSKAGGNSVIETLIGRQTEVLGDLRFTGGLHVDGCVKGSVTAAGDNARLSISAGGTIEGDVNVPIIALNGTIVGDVFASENLTVGPKAKVTGDLKYRVLAMEPGAAINGRLVHEDKLGEAEPPGGRGERDPSRDNGRDSKPVTDIRTAKARIEPELTAKSGSA